MTYYEPRRPNGGRQRLAKAVSIQLKFTLALTLTLSPKERGQHLDICLIILTVSLAVADGWPCFHERV